MMSKELPNPLVAELMDLVLSYAITHVDGEDDSQQNALYEQIESRLTELLAQQEAAAWQIMEHDGSWLPITKALFDRYKSTKDEQVRALTPLLETKE